MDYFQRKTIPYENVIRIINTKSNKGILQVLWEGEGYPF